MSRYSDWKASRSPFWESKRGKEDWSRIRFFAILGVPVLLLWFVFTVGILGGDALLLGIVGLFLFLMVVLEVQESRLDRLIWELETRGIDLGGMGGTHED